MKQAEIVIRKSPFTFFKQLLVIELLFALLPFVAVALLGLQDSYEGTGLARTIPFSLLLTLAVTLVQVLIIVLAFVTWYVPAYHVDRQTVMVRRANLLEDRKLADTQSIVRIETRQGWLGNRFGYGSLALYHGDGRQRVMLKNISDPARYAEEIDALIDPLAVTRSGPPTKALPALIAEGENQHTEFKASLVWDHRRQSANKDLYEPVMKNLAAFMNTSGGTLLIGVGDDGQVLGLDADLKTLRKPNTDGFENLFNMAFNQMIGVEYRQFVDLSFPQAEGKTICQASVRPADEPAYLVFKGTETFYIRAGNASQPLTVSKAARYIQGRFGDGLAGE